MINSDLLADLLDCPLERAIRWRHALLTAMQRFAINTPRRVAHFLAQLGHESQGLSCLEENLNYSKERLRELFATRIPENKLGQLSLNPMDLANYVYANRNGNGPVDSGDGYRYRGQGPIQITGRANYRRIGELIKQPLEEQPHLLQYKEQGSLAAAAYFFDNHLLQLADQNDTVGISQSINLGTTRTKTLPNGLTDRVKRTERALKLLQYVDCAAA